MHRDSSRGHAPTEGHDKHAGHDPEQFRRKGPAVGALLMSVSTIVVAANAQLLRRVDLRPAASRRIRPDASS
jgi:hypothetical protein